MAGSFDYMAGRGRAFSLAHPTMCQMACIITQFPCESDPAMNQAMLAGSEAAIQSRGNRYCKVFMKSVAAAQDMIKCKP